MTSALDKALGRGRAAVTAAAGPVAVQTTELYGDARASIQPVVGTGDRSAALAAGIIAFAAVGGLVVMRVIFRGAVS